MIQEIKKNIETEIRMAKELMEIIDKYMDLEQNEKKFADKIISSLKERIKMVNSSVLELVKNVSVAKPLSNNEKKLNIENVIFADYGQEIALLKKDKNKFLNELNISENAIKKIKSRKPKYEYFYEGYKKPNSYAILSNSIFLKLSRKIVEKKYFGNLSMDLRKANIDILATTYVSMMLFSTLLAFLIGMGISIFFTFFSIESTLPYIVKYDGPLIQRLIKIVFIPLLAPLIIFCAFYFYPLIERKSITAKIDSELPFVVIHMGSISGSGVEPTQIFKIVGLSKEYVYVRLEIRKILNQINIYGYDLVTALKNVASVTPSTKMAELLTGLATTINSGGSLKTFFEKRAESLLLNYKIEREKFTKIAETFMDIYISVVIATPMILLMLLVMISVSEIGGSLEVKNVTILIMLIISLVNILFIWIISLKQPSY